MDPTECLAGLLGELDSIGQPDPSEPFGVNITARDEAISRLDVLSRWLSSDGVPPDVDSAIETYRSRAERGKA